jgi:thioredoxin 1
MNLEEEISKSGYTIVKYYADWCGPCKAMNPIMDKLTINPDIDIKVVSVNIDNEIEITQNVVITSLPTISFYNKGDYMGRYVGAMSESMIMNVINGKTLLTK